MGWKHFASLDCGHLPSPCCCCPASWRPPCAPFSPSPRASPPSAPSATCVFRVSALFVLSVQFTRQLPFVFVLFVFVVAAAAPTQFRPPLAPFLLSHSHTRPPVCVCPCGCVCAMATIMRVDCQANSNHFVTAFLAFLWPFNALWLYSLSFSLPRHSICLLIVIFQLAVRCTLRIFRCPCELDDDPYKNSCRVISRSFHSLLAPSLALACATWATRTEGKSACARVCVRVTS